MTKLALPACALLLLFSASCTEECRRARDCLADEVCYRNVCQKASPPGAEGIECLSAADCGNGQDCIAGTCSLSGLGVPVNAQPFDINVTVTGPGVVTSNPQGINCPQMCSANYPPGTMITLTAAPDPGEPFAGWGGECANQGTNLTCNLSPTASIQVNATFGMMVNPQNYLVGVTVNGQGNVTSNPVGIDCPPDCTETFPANTTVTLTETPVVGLNFLGWGGDCAAEGTNMTCTRTLTASVAAIANFDL